MSLSNNAGSFTPRLPLAEALRPVSWQEVIGQSHLLGEGRPLNVAFNSGAPQSMIFWGPPGVGKTTLAQLAADCFDCEWIALSAVLAGVKDIRLAVEQAKNSLLDDRATILFIDEIHRFNKAQQDALLPFTETGLLTIIGATTENPSFEVNSALLSRAQVYVLKPLTNNDLKLLVARAQERVMPELTFESDALESLVTHADGDARRLYNILEYIQKAAHLVRQTTITLAYLEKIMPQVYRHFDKHGDRFYDQISALHKSVRGSHPDAALYWLTRMLDGGVDPTYLARRIIRMAWEDIGLADPKAMQIANDAALTYERLGSPEGELALAQAVIYLSIAAKSNAGYLAFKRAKQFVKQDITREVPLHLRNAPTALQKKLDHGKAYRYAHDEAYGYAPGVQYFPDQVTEPGWYQPVDRGLETNIRKKLEFLRQLDEENRRINKSAK